MGVSGLGSKRIARAESTVTLKGKERVCNSFFLDSGAHSLFNLHCFNHTKGPVIKPLGERYLWYSKDGKNLSRKFMCYLDAYVAFINSHQPGIDYYATVDVIYNPELSWKSLNYLIKQGLDPVPVIHHRTPLEWVRKHLDAGFKFIGLGGLGQESTKSDYCWWADRVFNLLCDNADRKPCVKTHGFAMTSYELMLRYPWFSVDSSSAFKVAGYGGIFVPHKRDGRFTFSVDPYIVAFSHRSSAKKEVGKHYANFGKGAKKVIRSWLSEIDVPVGKMNDNDVVLSYGVASEYNARAVANLRFFQKFCESLPPYPRTFDIPKPRKSDTFFNPEEIR